MVEAAPVTTALAGRRRVDRFPGPRVVTGCFVVLTVTSGLGFYGLAVYLNAFSRERGWPVASISLATTLFFIVGGVLGLTIARIIARHDVRVVIVAGGVFGGAALAVLGRVDERWQLYLVYAVFAAGFAGAGLVPATTVVTRWYHQRRSVALSVASTGLSVGGILITPVAKWLIDRRGLESATPILALIWVVGIIPVALWLVRPDPIVLGWMPDGDRVSPTEPVAAATGVRFDDAVRSRFYVAVTAGYLLVLGRRSARSSNSSSSSRTAPIPTRRRWRWRHWRGCRWSPDSPAVGSCPASRWPRSRVGSP